MEQTCCEFKHHDGVQVECIETEDGYRIVLKGDKEKIRVWKEKCCGEGARGSCC